MKTFVLLLILCVCSTQKFYSQEDDGVVSLDMPTRNSLTFNRYTLNPTFSFVREQNKYISFYNKREWVQFENAPLTYLASYSGRFGENIGAGLGLFQQNYGVLTTFGGILNFAYNAQLGRDNNLTFGINIGAYKSGVNTSNVITNFEDPSLQNIPDNFLLTVNPGINYGTEFLDFGLSINNLALYNVNSSTLIEDNPKQSLQAHFMYTGYMRNRGFFDDSKFTTLLRSDFQKEETIISAVTMITIPKGIWAQVGYNTLYGASGGLGLNLTTQIAIEYNYETAFGDLSNFGPSHEITLAYRFKNKNYYDYSREDEISGILSNENKRRRVTKTSKSKVASRTSTSTTQAKIEADKQKALVAEQKAKAESEKQAALIAEQNAKAKIEADEQAEISAAQQVAAGKAKQLEEQKAAELANAKAETDKIEADRIAKERAETRARLLAEQKAKQEADAKAKLAAEQKAQQEADAKAKLVAEQKAQQEADAKAKLVAEQKAQQEADAQAKLVAEQKAQQEADAKAKLVAEQKAQQEADAKAKLVAEQKAQQEADAQAKLVAEQKAQQEADAKAKLVAEQKAQQEVDAQAKLVAEQKAQQEADALAKEEEISNPTDQLGISMQEITKSAEDSKSVQNDLLEQFNSIIAIKDQDLKDLKEENDLSDKGIITQPKPFKSVTDENNTLNAIRSDLDNVIKSRSDKINELTKVYEERAENSVFEMDEVNLFYKKEIKRLKAEQSTANDLKSKLDLKLEDIKIATEFEKRRRIKRAAFNSEADRYSQDRDMLANIIKNTPISETPLKAEDFDFGEVQENSIKILKNIKNIESGYYLIIAVHSDANSRNKFITDVVASGRTDIDFFNDVNTSKYYIFYEKFDDIRSANNALSSKEDRPYNNKMSIVKIEN
ncbi:PorP/SprF family type IX secretion system membrane protein [Winogradskyella undariae]|uniref:PorP/SprF family type IX secretion system membrane protein n=1 Tax=Winogradskyella undariae TaxID=1285465 RepID=UPI0015C96482|nr:PorP/SprF family type IX secretion system membrane protein [Winogradskyella undariae]